MAKQPTKTKIADRSCPVTILLLGFSRIGQAEYTRRILKVIQKNRKTFILVRNKTSNDVSNKAADAKPIQIKWGVVI